MTDTTLPASAAAPTPLPALHGHLVPADPARLLRTLCNHWRHRFEIRRDDEHSAYIPFGADRSARFVAGDTQLRISAEAPDAAALAGLREVIEDHLRRFERDPELRFVWDGAPGPTA